MTQKGQASVCQWEEHGQADVCVYVCMRERERERERETKTHQTNALLFVVIISN